MQKGALFAPPWISRNAPALALGELERPAGLGLAVLLALDDARIAGQETAALKDTAQTPARNR